ncbi:hypothetical protein FNL10_07545 [Staphylococcus hominis]|uniref:hypothetical protein n=1 Tax=Staphylococcus hominis TaxID=1290 RepID=UPI0011602C6C|nr:hypothetical protein [Staphylococcus hominis]TRM00852.1 hypothetical protein FNL10_07545 [Staphylococcus hominis]
MEKFKIIVRWMMIFIVFCILFYLLAFTGGKFLFNRFTSDGRESFVAAITFFSVFATFGGAYLGAKVSGENTQKLELRRQRIQHLPNSWDLLRNIELIFEEVDKAISEIEPDYSMKTLNKKIKLNTKMEYKELTEQQVEKLIHYFKENGKHKLNEISTNLKEENAFYIMSFNEAIFLTIHGYYLSIKTIIDHYNTLENIEYVKININENMIEIFEIWLSKMQVFYYNFEKIKESTNRDLLVNKKAKKAYKEIEDM